MLRVSGGIRVNGNASNDDVVARVPSGVYYYTRVWRAERTMRRDFTALSLLSSLFSIYYQDVT